MRLPTLDIEKLANTKRIRKAALAQLSKRSFREGYSYPIGGSPLQGQYRSIRRSIATREIFDKLESLGLVRMEVKPDDTADIDDLKGDVYNAAVNTDIPAAKLAAEEKQFEERVNQDGVWGIIGEYRLSADHIWHNADSVWGFVGDDYKDTGYDTDVMAATISALRAARE
jgi:hypothetical protein